MASPTAPPAPSRPALGVLDRLELALRYLRHVWGGLLAGRGARRLEGSRVIESIEPGQADALVQRMGDAPASRAPFAKGEADVGGELSAFRRAALDEWEALEARFFGLAPRPASQFDSRFLAWDADQRSVAGARTSLLSACSLRSLALAHNLLLCQLRQWGAPVGAARPSASSGRREPVERRGRSEDALAQQTGEVLRGMPGLGDMVSDFFTLVGVRFVLSQWLPTRGAGEGLLSWDSILPQLLAESARAVLVLAYKSPMTRAVSPALAAAVGRVQLVPAQSPVQMLTRVGGRLAELKEFSTRLIGGPGDVAPEEPFAIGEFAREEVQRFDLLASPALGTAMVQDFHKALEAELEVFERKLFAATVAPRPRFYNLFFAWARRRFVLSEGDHLPLTDLCLHLVTLCHNLLVLQLATWRLAAQESGTAGSSSRVGSGQDTAGQASRATSRLRANLAKVGPLVAAEAAAVADAAPSVGDMLTVHMALEGLRRVFARHLPQPAPDPANATWREILPHLAPEVQTHVIALAAKSPVAGIAVPELEEALAARDVGWADLGTFLEDPAGGFVREFAVARLTAAALRDRQLVSLTVQWTLRRCLASSTVGGALVAGEFFLGIFLHLFGRREFDATLLVSEAARRRAAAALHKASGAFLAWFGDPRDDATAVFFRLLAEFLEVKLQLEAEPGKHEPARLNLLRQQWHRISTLGTRGLRRHPWQKRPQRLLRLFWLHFCGVVFERAGVPRGGLDTGSPEWDDLADLGARLFLDLARMKDTRERRRHQLANGQVHLATDTEAEEQDRIEEADFQLIARALDAAQANGAFRRALVVRRILIAPEPKEPLRLELNPELLRATAPRRP